MNKKENAVALREGLRARLRRKPQLPAPRFTLHGFWRSGPTYKVALMLSLAHVPFVYAHVDLDKGEQRTEDFLSRNRYGQVPCLFDGKLALNQSAAILEHLARVLGKFMPAGLEAQARVREWLFWDFDNLSRPIYRTRAIQAGRRSAAAEVVEAYRAEALAALDALEALMPASGYVVGARPSIADIDIYGVIHYLPECGLDRARWPRIDAWAARIEALPGFALPDQLMPKQCAYEPTATRAAANRRRAAPRSAERHA
jgi:glutathione S-transferase